MRTYRGGRRLAPGIAMLGGLLIALVAGSARPAVAGGTATDPVVREVVRMLEAKVVEPVIVRWLDGGNRHPKEIGSDDLIALKEAGASQALMEKLLDSVGKPAPPPAPEPAPAPEAKPAPPSGPASTPPEPAPKAAPAPPPPAAPAPPAPLAAAPVAPPSATGVAAGAVKVRFDIQYKPVFGEDEDRWSLFVYLDGETLALSRPAAVAMLTRNLSFEKMLAPGHHVVRVVQERHEKKRGQERWTNQARVAPVVLAFDLPPGGPARVEVHMDQVKLRSATKGPVSFTAAQGDRVLAHVEQTGGAADRWPALCEEVESNQEAGTAPTATVRRQLRDCLRWAELWPGLAPVSSREKVRAELARSQFQPLTSQESGN